ncbi:RpiB/LacA/LacB family sugar-phosphate isomerase [Candidatus Saccharibacteria bacterium]|nr:RpiB/LacA/LacB family sugar-phosphate isomerase [Candidatus Saccharibacteria bacterium]
MPSVFIAADHRGFELKNRLLALYPDFTDLGPKAYNPDDDYNDAALAVSRNVLETPDSFGVLICGSAIGVSIQANRFKKVRAAVCSCPESAKLSRLHNNANILCLSADRVKTDADFTKARDTLGAFLTTAFSNEPRHLRRINRLDEETL